MDQKEMFKPITDGIKEGFNEIGFDLSEREEKIVAFTVKATVLIVEKFLRDEIEKDEG